MHTKPLFPCTIECGGKIGPEQHTRLCNVIITNMIHYEHALEEADTDPKDFMEQIECHIKVKKRNQSAKLQDILIDLKISDTVEDLLKATIFNLCVEYATRKQSKFNGTSVVHTVSCAKEKQMLLRDVREARRYIRVHKGTLSMLKTSGSFQTTDNESNTCGKRYFRRICYNTSREITTYTNSGNDMMCHCVAVHPARMLGTVQTIYVTVNANSYTRGHGTA